MPNSLRNPAGDVLCDTLLNQQAVLEDTVKQKRISKNVDRRISNWILDYSSTSERLS